MLTFPQISASGPGIKTELQNLGFPATLKYLRDRGVGAHLLDDLGIHILPASEVIGRSRGVATADDRLAIVFPHFDVAGDYIDWWSARLVDTGLRPVVPSFANLVPQKRGKMYCPPNEAPHAYLPPLLNWRALQRGDRVYIHESCIKAINGARLGRWSVGLNGVWGWTSKKNGVSLVQELRDLPWKGLNLQPVIVFDSNAADNWDVQAAITQLASKLLEITGQEARHILLPTRADGSHWGFDDFCVQMGDEAAGAFLDGEGDVVEISELQRYKIMLNSEVCVVRSLGRIAEQETGTLMSRQVFTDVNYAHYVAQVGDKIVNVPRAWLTDPRRVEVESLEYIPGADKIANDCLNLWRPSDLQPAEGDISRWLTPLQRNVTDPGLRKWIIQWLAYPLQHPGEKLHSFLHIYGPPGTGKQALIYPLMKIYGTANAIVIGKDDIASAYNEIYAAKQLINVDELESSAASSAINQKVKMIVTGDRMIINKKGQPQYSVRNCAQLVTTGNYLDSIKLDDDDRRACVIKYGERGEGLGEEFWKDYYNWMDDGGGAEAVYHYLLAVDLEGFNPKGWAPMTEDKKDVTQASRSALEQWVGQLWEDPDAVLSPILRGRMLFTNDELAPLAFGDDPFGVTPGKKASLGIKMTSVGFKRTANIKVGGKPIRLWIVRGREREWTNDEIHSHLKVHAFKG